MTRRRADRTAVASPRRRLCGRRLGAADESGTTYRVTSPDVRPYG